MHSISSIPFDSLISKVIIVLAVFLSCVLLLVVLVCSYVIYSIKTMDNVVRIELKTQTPQELPVGSRQDYTENEVEEDDDISSAIHVTNDESAPYFIPRKSDNSLFNSVACFVDPLPSETVNFPFHSSLNDLLTFATTLAEVFDDNEAFLEKSWFLSYLSSQESSGFHYTAEVLTSLIDEYREMFPSLWCNDNYISSLVLSTLSRNLQQDICVLYYQPKMDLSLNIVFYRDGMVKRYETNLENECGFWLFYDGYYFYPYFKSRFVDQQQLLRIKESYPLDNSGIQDTVTVTLLQPNLSQCLSIHRFQKQNKCDLQIYYGDCKLYPDEAESSKALFLLTLKKLFLSTTPLTEDDKKKIQDHLQEYSQRLFVSKTVINQFVSKIFSLLPQQEVDLPTTASPMHTLLPSGFDNNVNCTVEDYGDEIRFSKLSSALEIALLDNLKGHPYSKLASVSNDVLQCLSSIPTVDAEAFGEGLQSLFPEAAELKQLYQQWSDTRMSDSFAGNIVVDRAKVLLEILIEDRASSIKNILKYTDIFREFLRDPAQLAVRSDVIRHLQTEYDQVFELLKEAKTSYVNSERLGEFKGILFKLFEQVFPNSFPSSELRGHLEYMNSKPSTHRENDIDEHMHCLLRIFAKYIFWYEMKIDNSAKVFQVTLEDGSLAEVMDLLAANYFELFDLSVSTASPAALVETPSFLVSLENYGPIELQIFCTNALHVSSFVRIHLPSCNVVISAKQLVCTATLEIDVSGKNGKNTWENNYSEGDGESGSPGANGGNILIAVDNYPAVQSKLILKLDGGAGAIGQNARAKADDGEPGVDGSDPSPDLNILWETWNNYLVFNLRQIELGTKGTFGKMGKPGYNAGQGGQGGKGGTAELRTFSGFIEWQTLSGETGAVGKDGIPGKGGSGGRNGVDGADLSIILNRRIFGVKPIIKRLRIQGREDLLTHPEVRSDRLASSEEFLDKERKTVIERSIFAINHVSDEEYVAVESKQPDGINGLYSAAKVQVTVISPINLSSIYSSQMAVVKAANAEANRNMVSISNTFSTISAEQFNGKSKAKDSQSNSSEFQIQVEHKDVSNRSKDLQRFALSSVTENIISFSLPQPSSDILIPFFVGDNLGTKLHNVNYNMCRLLALLDTGKPLLGKDFFSKVPAILQRIQNNVILSEISEPIVAKWIAYLYVIIRALVLSVDYGTENPKKDLIGLFEQLQNWSYFNHQSVYESLFLSYVKWNLSISSDVKLSEMQLNSIADTYTFHSMPAEFPSDEAISSRLPRDLQARMWLELMLPPLGDNVVHNQLVVELYAQFNLHPCGSNLLAVLHTFHEQLSILDYVTFNNTYALWQHVEERTLRHNIGLFELSTPLLLGEFSFYSFVAWWLDVHFPTLLDSTDTTASMLKSMENWEVDECIENMKYIPLYTPSTAASRKIAFYLFQKLRTDIMNPTIAEDFFVVLLDSLPSFTGTELKLLIETLAKEGNMISTNDKSRRQKMLHLRQKAKVAMISQCCDQLAQFIKCSESQLRDMWFSPNTPVQRCVERMLENDVETNFDRLTRDLSSTVYNFTTRNNFQCIATLIECFENLPEELNISVPGGMKLSFPSFIERINQIYTHFRGLREISECRFYNFWAAEVFHETVNLLSDCLLRKSHEIAAIDFLNYQGLNCDKIEKNLEKMNVLVALFPSALIPDDFSLPEDILGKIRLITKSFKPISPNEKRLIFLVASLEAEVFYNIAGELDIFEPRKIALAYFTNSKSIHHELSTLEKFIAIVLQDTNSSLDLVYLLTHMYFEKSILNKENTSLTDMMYIFGCTNAHYFSLLRYDLSRVLLAKTNQDSRWACEQIQASCFQLWKHFLQQKEWLEAFSCLEVVELCTMYSLDNGYCEPFWDFIKTVFLQCSETELTEKSVLEYFAACLFPSCQMYCAELINSICAHTTLKNELTLMVNEENIRNSSYLGGFYHELKVRMQLIEVLAEISRSTRTENPPTEDHMSYEFSTIVSLFEQIMYDSDYFIERLRYWMGSQPSSWTSLALTVALTDKVCFMTNKWYNGTDCDDNIDNYRSVLETLESSSIDASILPYLLHRIDEEIILTSATNETKLENKPRVTPIHIVDIVRQLIHCDYINHITTSDLKELSLVLWENVLKEQRVRNAVIRLSNNASQAMRLFLEQIWVAIFHFYGVSNVDHFLKFLRQVFAKVTNWDELLPLCSISKVLYYKHLSWSDVQNVVLSENILYGQWPASLQELVEQQQGTNDTKLTMAQLLSSLHSQTAIDSASITNLKFPSKEYNEVLALAVDLETNLSSLTPSSSYYSVANPSFANLCAKFYGHKTLQKRIEHVMTNLKDIILFIVGAMLETNHKAAKSTQIATMLIAMFGSSSSHVTDKRIILSQIKTGEGKTFIVACLAALKAFCGFHVHIISSNRDLAQSAVDEHVSFFKALGISVDCNCRVFKEEDADGKEIVVEAGQKSNVYENQVVYGDIQSFEGDYLRSLTPSHGASSSNKFFFRGKESTFLIVDEVDFMAVDKCLDSLYLSSKVPVMKSTETLFVQIVAAVSRLQAHSVEERDAKLAEMQKRIEYGLNDGTIDIAPELRSFFALQLPQLLRRAAFAIHETCPDTSFVIRNGKVVIMDTNTGVEEYSSRWMDGISCFLDLFYRCQFEAEALRANFISHKTFFELYGTNIFGLSGTLGDADTRNLIHEMYPSYFVDVPRELPRPFTMMPPKVFTSISLWLQEILHECQHVVTEQKRVVLIIVETVATAKKIQTKLQSDELLKSKIVLYLEDGHESNCKDVFDDSKILVATNKGGRGTDIKLGSSILANGGLHVVVSSLPSNSRTIDQAFGRAARNGQKGSGRFIVKVSEAVPNIPFPTEEDLTDMRDIVNLELHMHQNLRMGRMEHSQLLLRSLRELEIEDALLDKYRKFKNRTLTKAEILSENMKQHLQTKLDRYFGMFLINLSAKTELIGNFDASMREYEHEVENKFSIEKDSTEDILQLGRIRLQQQQWSSAEHEFSKILFPEEPDFLGEDGKQNSHCQIKNLLKTVQEQNNIDFFGFSSMGFCLSLCNNPEKQPLFQRMETRKKMFVALIRTKHRFQRLMHSFSSCADIIHYVTDKNPYVNQAIGQNHGLYRDQCYQRMMVFHTHLQLLEAAIGSESSPDMFQEAQIPITAAMSSTIYRFLVQQEVLVDAVVLSSYIPAKKNENQVVEEEDVELSTTIESCLDMCVTSKILPQESRDTLKTFLHGKAKNFHTQNGSNCNVSVEDLLPYVHGADEVLKICFGEEQVRQELMLGSNSTNVTLDTIREKWRTLNESDSKNYATIPETNIDWAVAEEVEIDGGGFVLNEIARNDITSATTIYKKLLEERLLTKIQLVKLDKNSRTHIEDAIGQISAHDKYRTLLLKESEDGLESVSWLQFLQTKFHSITEHAPCVFHSHLFPFRSQQEEAEALFTNLMLQDVLVSHHLHPQHCWKPYDSTKKKSSEQQLHDVIRTLLQSTFPAEKKCWSKSEEEKVVRHVQKKIGGLLGVLRNFDDATTQWLSCSIVNANHPDVKKYFHDQLPVTGLQYVHDFGLDHFLLWRKGKENVASYNTALLLLVVSMSQMALGIACIALSATTGCVGMFSLGKFLLDEGINDFAYFMLAQCLGMRITLQDYLIQKTISCAASLASYGASVYFSKSTVTVKSSLVLGGETSSVVMAQKATNYMLQRTQGKVFSTLNSLLVQQALAGGIDFILKKCLSQISTIVISFVLDKHRRYLAKDLQFAVADLCQKQTSIEGLKAAVSDCLGTVNQDRSAHIDTYLNRKVVMQQCTQYLHSAIHTLCVKNHNYILSSTNITVDQVLFVQQVIKLAEQLLIGSSHVFKLQHIVKQYSGKLKDDLKRLDIEPSHGAEGTEMVTDDFAPTLLNIILDSEIEQVGTALRICVEEIEDFLVQETTYLLITDDLRQMLHDQFQNLMQQQELTLFAHYDYFHASAATAFSSVTINSETTTAPTTTTSTVSSSTTHSAMMQHKLHATLAEQLHTKHRTVLEQQRSSASNAKSFSRKEIKRMKKKMAKQQRRLNATRR